MATKFLNGVDLTNQKAVNLADPSAATDAATKQYVDNVARGLHWKTAVRAATTGNVTLASAVANGSVLDGITLATGDRILIKDQTDATENGIYIVAATGAPSRSSDMAVGSDADGVTVTVSSGTVNGDLVFIQTEDDVVVGDELTFSQLGGGGVTYTAGDGLNLDGTTFNVGAGNGIGVNSTAVSAVGDASRSVSVTGSGIGVTPDPNGGLEHNSTTGLRVKAGTNLERTASGGALRIAATAAGAGLTGGAASPLAVGAGSGITVSTDEVSVDSTVVRTSDMTSVVRKYSENVPSGNTTANITHSLATQDVTVMVRTNGAAPYEVVFPDIYIVDANTVRLGFATAPTSGQYRVIVHG